MDEASIFFVEREREERKAMKTRRVKKVRNTFVSLKQRLKQRHEDEGEDEGEGKSKKKEV